jgi:hypothetical protein
MAHSAVTEAPGNRVASVGVPIEGLKTSGRLREAFSRSMLPTYRTKPSTQAKPSDQLQPTWSPITPDGTSFASLYNQMQPTT